MIQERDERECLGKLFTKCLIRRIESSSLEYLSVKTLSNVFNGCRDFFSLRPDKFSCQRVQSHTCLSYAECRRKSWNKSDWQYANIFDKWEQWKLAFKLSSEEFSCKRVQSQTCLSYAECSQKSLVCKMYEIVNKQVKFLTSQYIGTCKSAYTKGYAQNWALTFFR